MAYPRLAASPFASTDLRDAAGSTARGTPQQPLQRYLRTLWRGAPALAEAPLGPFIVGQTIHLPTSRPAADDAAAWHWYRAAAAHACAHLVYSPPVFDGRGLGPIVRALLGVLEDARVEALACRELPGLRRLWAPLHTASARDGEGFEALLLRLARSLIDPAHDDSHPWVRKGRRLFFVEPESQVLALRRPAELRVAATLLGNDIGQMRLQFNARLYVPGPDYRDDSRWMWPAPESHEPATAGGGVARAAHSSPHDDTPPVDTRPDNTPPGNSPPPTPPCHYPEWDRLIARLRPAWCAVFEQPADPPSGGDASVIRVDPLTHPLRTPLRRALAHAASRAAKRLQIGEEGERLNAGALVRAGIAQRLRLPVDARVHLRSQRARPRGRAVVLIDQSASSAEAWGRSGRSLLQGAGEVAALVVAAFEAVGVTAALGAFCSSGRSRVQVRLVKDFTDALDAPALGRLGALRSLHSTRLGAAIRHAAGRLAAGPPGDARQLLLVTDGQPHDIDVHDPHYLVEDARRAVLQAERQGVRVACLVLDSAGAAVARRVFGARRVAVLDTIDRLPQAARRLAL